ncbi:hypothetical protein B0J11DRAFT_139431 [Dendryphion nanum]|uniref:Uncharacterized protein n=1 Tax=Dendryphion nanum TaxID=256645 RepID=A0A9P9IA39_9PLEO|nr:hypothetical protein B0J11DRAFT_139431 [Dendryphion nanum]
MHRMQIVLILCDHKSFVLPLQFSFPLPHHTNHIHSFKAGPFFHSLAKPYSKIPYTLCVFKFLRAANKMLGRIIIVASVALSVLAAPLPVVKEANTVARQAFVEPAFSNGKREPGNWQKRQDGQGYHTDSIDHGSAKRQDSSGGIVERGDVVMSNGAARRQVDFVDDGTDHRQKARQVDFVDDGTDHRQKARQVDFVDDGTDHRQKARQIDFVDDGTDHRQKARQVDFVDDGTDHRQKARQVDFVDDGTDHRQKSRQIDFVDDGTDHRQKSRQVDFVDVSEGDGNRQ